MTVNEAIEILFRGVKQACGHPMIGMVSAKDLDEAQRVLSIRFATNGKAPATKKPRTKRRPVVVATRNPNGSE